MADKSQWTLIMKTDISCRYVSGFMSLIPRKTKERRTSSQYEERFSFTSVVKFPSSLCLEEGLCLFKIVGPLGNFPHHQLTKRQGDAISKQCVPFRQRIVVVWSLILEYCCGVQLYVKSITSQVILQLGICCLQSVWFRCGQSYQVGYAALLLLYLLFSNLRNINNHLNLYLMTRSNVAKMSQVQIFGIFFQLSKNYNNEDLTMWGICHYTTLKLFAGHF